jgi:serine/threonine protein kinase
MFACSYSAVPVEMQMLGAARGMLYLHDSRPPIIHRDLKSPNLLVDDAGRIKVCGGSDLHCLAVQNSESTLGWPLLAGGRSALLGALLRFPSCRFPSLPAPTPCSPLPHKQVGDFNLSKVMEGSMASTVGGANNPRWMAPELLLGGQATFASDVFAFGVVMWEVLTWDIPWQTDPAFAVGEVLRGGSTGAKFAALACRMLF